MCLSLLFQLFPLPAAAQGGAQEPPSFDGYIVRLRDDVPLARTMSDEDAYDSLGNFLVVDDLAQVQDIPQELVAYIEPNYIVELFDDAEPALFVPNDTYYQDYQWNLQKTGAMAAYEKGLLGEGVTVAVIDSGDRKSVV